MQLRDYQRADVETIKKLKQIGIFNEQRTGKTPTVITALNEMNIQNYIVVCPASLQYMWQEAIAVWSNTQAIVYSENSEEETIALWKQGAYPLIINYERLRGNKNKECMLYHYMRTHKSTAVILDEAHTIRNRKSLTYKTCSMLGRHTEVRIAITGTPAYNTTKDVWAVVTWIQPHSLGTYYEFCHEYFEVAIQRTRTRSFEVVADDCVPIKLKQLSELLSKISIQRKRKDIMEWVTEIEPTIIKLPPTTEQTVAIENLQNYFEYKGVVTKNLLDNMQKIRQLCADPALLKLSGGSPKTDWVVTYLKENPDKYVIIFSLSTKYINLLTTQFEKLNIKHTKIVGDTPILERQTNINMFQNGVSKVLLIQTLCGKEGYTLDSADTAIFLDMYPPAGAFKQAEDRLVATSPAALKPQELIHVMLRGTYDERLFKLVADNIAETEVLNDYHKYINKEVR